jgi:Fe-S oxidoreductase
VLERLRPYVREGIPVVGLEPSCLAVFKDELTKMFPDDDDAGRLAGHALHFGEFFERYEIDVPRLEGEAVLWGHCHHRATGGVDTEKSVLERMGLRVDSVEGGCCGLAGSWGFEKGKYEISMDCGEQALLPAVRKASDDTVVVANGFSCKTQIEQAGTGRRALHLGEVLRLARGGSGSGMPEERVPDARPAPSMARRAVRTAGPVAVLVGAGVGAAAAGMRVANRG